jgi:alkanesulfonate monooxygenase SsuD/methylene tetrahydromethanopterin reductase-like flavin-dependent oxidoreductase (luciferase family)
MTARPVLLAAALTDPRPQPDLASWLSLAQTAEQAGLDFVTIEAGPLDPLLVAALLAPLTRTLGLMSVATTTTTEPFHVSTELATIDVVSRGRAGWLAEVASRQDAEGAVTWAVPDDVAGDAAEHLDAVRRLWDSWEDGAEIRDAATARFIDRDRVHHVDFRGEHLSVRGPSITPRPPQGHPVVAIRARDEATLRLAAEHADLVLSADLDAMPVQPLRFLEVHVEPTQLDGLADRLASVHARGADGVLLHAADLAGTLARLMPELQDRGLRAAEGPSASLRERLGLTPAVNRYAVRV